MSDPLTSIPPPRLAGGDRPRASLGLFFALSYALMWACFLPVAAGRVPAPLRSAVLLLGAFAPSFAALWVVGRSEGAAGVRRLLARIVQGPVAARWVAFAAVYMAAVKLLVAVLHRALFGAWPRFGAEPWALIPAAILFSWPFQAGEEVGWRGFALPRLAARFGLGPASLLLGVLWGFWHLPQFFVPGADYGQSVWVFALQVTAISVTMAWLYGHVNGSLWPVMLLHSAVNNSKDIVPSALPGGAGVFGLRASAVGWLTVGVLWLVALVLLARMPSAERLQPGAGGGGPAGGDVLGSRARRAEGAPP